MPLQGSGSISISDIQTELGLTPGDPISISGYNGTGGAVQPGSLFYEATGTINKAEPHSISEFYGYNQVDDFIMSTNSYSTAGEACDDTDIGSTLWHEGSGAYPEVGDKIWNEGTSTTVFNGGGLWYRIVAEDHVVRIDAAGVVLEKEDCAQTFSFTLSQTTVDEDATTVDITITSNTNWTLSEIVSWASIASPTGSGNGSKVLSIDAHTGTGTRTVTVTGTYGLGNQQSDVDQLDIPYVSNSLGYDLTTESTACAATPAVVYLDTSDLSTATVLLNSFQTDLGATGYYSDGAVVRFWNKTSGSFTSTNLCI